MKLRHLTTSALALILISACSDSTGVEVDDLAGVWTAQSLVFTSVADPQLSVDLVVSEGAAATLTLGEDATYTLVITFTQFPDENENEAGTYVVTGSTLTLSLNGTGSPEPFTIVRDGDTMTLTATDDEFDFDDNGVDEPAIMVITLTR